MTQSEGFKHIKVTLAEEEDEIIHVGAVQETPETVSEPSPESDDGDEPSIAEQPKPPAKPKRPKGEKGEIRETTLEDLKPQPMPFAQKVVVIAAVVCIIGAIAYYLAFLR